MKLIKITFFLLILTFFARIPAEEPAIKRYTINNQQDIDLVTAQSELENVELYITKAPIFQSKTPQPYNLSAFSNLTKLKTLIYGNRWDLYITPFFWDSLLSLPKIESLERLSVSTGMNTFLDPLMPEGGISIFFNFLADNFPNLKSLELKRVAIQDNVAELATLFPHLEELSLVESLKKGDFQGLELFKDLKILNLEKNIIFSPESISNSIFQIKELESLNIGKPYAIFPLWDGQPIFNNYVPGDFFINKNLPKLKSLDLSELILENLDLSSFAPQLEKLVLNDAILKNKSIAQIELLQNLKELDLERISLSKDELELLGQVSMPVLAKLNLQGTPAKTFPFDTFAPNLRYLNLNESNVTGGDIKKISMLTNLENLQLEKTKISSPSISHLKTLDKLITLNLKGTNIRDSNLDVLQNLSNLQELDISETNISLVDFQKLSLLKQLKKLTITQLKNSNIDKAMIEQLKTALPNTQVID